MDSSIAGFLRKLNPTGPQGFEGLVARLLEKITGKRFFLARSGRQEGRDMVSDRWAGNLMAVECKRFGENTALNERDLTAGLVQACRDLPSLELWVLVTSRPVEDQLITRLIDIGRKEGVEVFAISSADGEPSSLSVLCSQASDVVESFVTGKWNADDRSGLLSLLTQASKHVNYTNQVNRLKNELTSSLIGHDHFCDNQASWLITNFSSEIAARSVFHQPLHVASSSSQLIPRTSSNEWLDSWYNDWNKQSPFFALTGEEGDGKSWAMASWVAGKTQNEQLFPPVLFFTSYDVTTSDITELISSRIAQLHGEPHPGYWKKRLNRWAERASEPKPLLILVLDGINERQDSCFWRTLLEGLTAHPWRHMLAIALTCRTRYWERHFSTLKHIGKRQEVLLPFSDFELDGALALRQLVRSDFPPELIKLMSRPRYFDMAVKHRDRMAASGDYTVARLIFEDWRDRYQRKSINLIEPESFQDFIKDLASTQINGRGGLRGQEVAGLLPPEADIPRMLEELRSGGVLNGTGNTYFVDEGKLVLGFGFLLADEVRRKNTVDQESIRETLAGWLEPSGADLLAKICGMAVCVAMEDSQFSTFGRTALLQFWVESQNLYEGVEHEFQAYFPVDPSSYAMLAEHVWSYRNNLPWVQELIVRAMIRWAKESPPVHDQLPAIMKRWLGFVNINGHTWRSRSSNEDATQLRQDIADKLECEAIPGLTINLVGHELHLIDDEGLLRLGRAALNIISHLSRDNFLHAIATGCLAEEVMGWPDKHDLFSWVLRSSKDSITPGVICEVEELSSYGSLIGLKAAYRLLGYEGSENAIVVREGLPPSLIEVNEIIRKHREDPCHSFFAWTQSECEQCLPREDVAPWDLVRKIKPYCPDPNLPRPAGLAERIGPLAHSIDLSQLMAEGRNYTPTDLAFEEIEPSLCVYAPEEMAELIRQLAMTVQTRSNGALQSLAQFLIKHYLILRSHELEAIREVWQTLVSTPEPWDDEVKWTEMYLFASVLKSLPALEQLNALLLRPEVAFDWTRLEASFKIIENPSEVKGLLSLVEEPWCFARKLWFLAAHPESVPTECLEQLCLLAGHENEAVRILTLRILWLKQEGGNFSYVPSSWKWTPECNEKEAHWGSLLLAEAIDIFTYKELSGRIHPSYLAFALDLRRRVPMDEELFVNDMMNIGVDEAEPDNFEDIPLSQVNTSLNGDYPQLESALPNYQLIFPGRKFTSADAHWGGVGVDATMGFGEALKSQSHEEVNRIAQILFDFSREQRNRGHFWVDCSFFAPILSEIVKVYPLVVESWVHPVLEGNLDVSSRLFFNRGIYEALCDALLDSQPETGAKLYRALKSENPPIRFTATETGCDRIDHYLFRAPGHPLILELWDEWYEKMNSDVDLLNLVLLTTHNDNANDWLQERITRGFDSVVPYRRALSFILLGFLGETREEIQARGRKETSPVWLDHVAQKAEMFRKKDQWAKHWYKQFMSVEDELTAWSSFRLFLQSVDRRFWYWKSSEETSCMDSISFQRRIPFLLDNDTEIKEAIKKNEKKYGDFFLGQKVEKGHVWPWMVRL